MDGDRAKTQEQVFADMHRELRSWNSKIPESADRLDPILRIMMQMHAGELSRLDQRLSDLWDRATSSLIRSLNPECKRWPIPAYTVMQCEVTDPVAQIDRHTRFFFREEREGGQTFFFAPLQSEKLIQATAKYVFLTSGDEIIEVAGDTASRGDTFGGRFTKPGTRIYVGVEYKGKPADLAGATVFLNSEQSVLKQLRWGYWYASASSGEFYEDVSFCPGLTSTVDDIVNRDGSTGFGGLRDAKALFGELEDSFVVIPDQFAKTLDYAPPCAELIRLLEANGMTTPESDGAMFWIRIDLPDGGNKTKLGHPVGFHLDCCVVTNQNELTLFKHTGGNRLVEIEIPEPIETVLGITSAVDSSGRDYLPRHMLYSDRSAGTYVLDQKLNQLVLWFDYSREQNLPPDSITVTYAVTAATRANGIGVGKITELYESHPGIDVGKNLIPTAGAIPAKTEEQIVDEVAARLRGRDRALTFDEIRRWTLSFDARIMAAECRNGIERCDSGVRRCIVVALDLDRDRFCSPNEIDLLAQRLQSFLKSRAPLNTHFSVERGK